MFEKTPLWPILILALALRLPGWFTQDQKSKYELFDQDEFQYVEMAVSLMQGLDTTLFADWEVEKYIYNVRGFGIQVGGLAFFYHKLSSAELDATTLIMIGRGLSTLYALLLIILLHRISLYFFKERSIAWLAALFLTIFDLNITYSHYGIPAVSYVFWAYLTVFLLLKWHDLLQEGEKTRTLLLLAIPFSAAMVFATKFDFIPILLGGAILFFLVYQKKLSLPRAVGLGFWFPIAFLFSFLLATAFTLDFAEVKHSFEYLYEQNKNVIERDNHLLHNPFLYLMATIGGSSLLAVGAAFYGLSLFYKNRKRKTRAAQFGILLFFLFLEFGVRWNLDTPFVRRVNIFMPFVALMASYGLIGLSKKRTRYRWAPVILVLVYTFVLTSLSQTNAWNDTRYRARIYLNTQHADAKVCYSYYVRIPGMPSPFLKKEADLLILHETYYGRYWKYFTSPFQYPPACCQEVYHCFSGTEECEFYQQLLAGEDEDFELLKIIPTREIFPERLVYKYLFGSYETFQGDVRIYQRISATSGL